MTIKKQNTSLHEAPVTRNNYPWLSFLFALPAFLLALVVHAGCYFLFGLRSMGVLFTGLILGGILATIAFGLMLDALVRSMKTRKVGLIGCRTVTMMAMIAVAFAYFKCGIPLLFMHHGIIMRVRSEVDVTALQTWTEKQTANVEQLDWDHLELPIQQSVDSQTGHIYRPTVGTMENGSMCVCIRKNFGGGFWDFGVEIGPRDMKPSFDPDARYHTWRQGIYTWL